MVFRVRFSTEPALMMRSNSKQPFWFTGDMTPALSACAWMLERRGCAGVLSFMGEGARARVTGVGLGGVCCAPSAMAAVSLHQVAGGCRVRGGWIRQSRRLVCCCWGRYISAAMMEVMQIDRRATGGMHGRGCFKLSRSTMASSSGQRYICGAFARLSRQSGEVRPRLPSPPPLDVSLWEWMRSECV